MYNGRVQRDYDFVVMSTIMLWSSTFNQLYVLELI